MNRNAIIAIVIGVLLIGGIIYANNPNANKSTNQEQARNTSQQTQPDTTGQDQITPPATEAPNMAAPTAGADTSEIKRFTVSGSDFKFAPNEIRVKKGDIVQLTFLRESGFHDLVIDEFNAKTKQLQAPQQETITFKADKTGIFEYYCSVGNHRAQGMIGKLIVVE